jgi:hypothetical protein
VILPDGTEPDFVMGYRYNKVTKREGQLERIKRLNLDGGETWADAEAAKERYFVKKGKRDAVLPKCARASLQLVYEDKTKVQEGAYPVKGYPHRADPLHKTREPEGPLLLPKGTPCWTAREMVRGLPKGTGGGHRPGSSSNSSRGRPISAGTGRAMNRSFN